MKLPKTLLIISFLMVLTVISLVIYSYFCKEAKQRESQQVQEFLTEINKVINLMNVVRNEMPKELSETHEYLMNDGLGGKLYRADPKLKDQIMYHGARTKSIYINPSIKLRSELWIPIFYHEVSHNYWHTKNPVNTFEEFKYQLFDSENYAYTVSAQAWNLVTKHYPVVEEDLKTEVEQRLFKNYSNETKVYEEMIKGNSMAQELWTKVIEADIGQQEKYQQILFQD